MRQHASGRTRVRDPVAGWLAPRREDEAEAGEQTEFFASTRWYYASSLILAVVCWWVVTEAGVSRELAALACLCVVLPYDLLFFELNPPKKRE